MKNTESWGMHVDTGMRFSMNFSHEKFMGKFSVNFVGTGKARTGSTQGIESGCSTGEVCWEYFCILALVLFYESKMDQN